MQWIYIIYIISRVMFAMYYHQSQVVSFKMSDHIVWCSSWCLWCDDRSYQKRWFTLWFTYSITFCCSVCLFFFAYHLVIIQQSHLNIPTIGRTLYIPYKPRPPPPTVYKSPEGCKRSTLRELRNLKEDSFSHRIHFHGILVGGFNPLEKYYSKWESYKKIFETTTQYIYLNLVDVY